MPTQLSIRWYPIANGALASFSRSDLEVPVFTLGGETGQNIYELRHDMQKFSLTTYRLGRMDVTGFIRSRLTGLYEYSIRRSTYGRSRENPFGITRERDGVFYGVVRPNDNDIEPVYDEHGIRHGRIPDVSTENFELGFVYSFAGLIPRFPMVRSNPEENSNPYLGEQELSELGLPSFIIPEHEPAMPAPSPEIHRPTRFERKPVI